MLGDGSKPVLMIFDRPAVGQAYGQACRQAYQRSTKSTNAIQPHLLRNPTPIHAQRHATNLIGCRRAKEHGQSAQLFNGDEFQ